MKNLKFGVLALTIVASISAHAQISGDVVKIGLLADLSSVYADLTGENHVLAAKFAIEDMGGTINGKKIELLVADFQQKADVSLAIARKWFDQDGVDMIIDAPNSAIAFTIANLAKEKNKVYLSGAASSDLTGKFCTPNSAHFLLDTYALANIAINAMTDRGSKNWYSITVDNAGRRDIISEAGS